MLKRKKPRAESEEVNAGSMADIAFLLLIFFLVATTLTTDKGLMLKLPPEDRPQTELNERNVFNIKLNSSNALMVEGEVRDDLRGLDGELEEFIMNNGTDPLSSESPAKAIISLKTNRGTDYEKFIEVLDEVKGVYYNIYASRVGLTSQQYRSLKLDKPAHKALYDQGKAGIPMNISIAEPDR